MNEPFVIKIEEPEWDISSCDRLGELISPALDHPNVVIDLSAVEYLDSRSLAKFVEMRRKRVLKHGYPPAHLVLKTNAGVSRLFRGLTSFGRFMVRWKLPLLRLFRSEQRAHSRAVAVLDFRPR